MTSISTQRRRQSLLQYFLKEKRTILDDGNDIIVDTRNQNEEDYLTSDWRSRGMNMNIEKMKEDYEEEGYYEENALLTQKQSEKSDLELRGDRAELEKMVADLREREKCLSIVRRNTNINVEPC